MLDFSDDKQLGKLHKLAMEALLDGEQEVVFDFGPAEPAALVLYARGHERGVARRKEEQRTDLLQREAEAISIALGTHTEDLGPHFIAGSFEDQMYRGYGIGSIFDPVSGCYDPGAAEDEFDEKFD
jgi:hypothetical protein